MAFSKRTGMENYNVQQSQVSLTHCKPSGELLDSPSLLSLRRELGPDLPTRRAGWQPRQRWINCLYDVILPMPVPDLWPHTCFPCRCLWHSALPRLLQAAWGTCSRNTSGISSRQQKNPAWQPTCYFSSSVLAGLSLRDMTPLAWLASPLACRSDHEVGRGVLSIRSAPTVPASPVPWNSLLRWNCRPLKSMPYKKRSAGPHSN